MLIFAVKLRRWKIISYPVLWVVGPVLQCVVTIYAVVTSRKRTWGGPRVRVGPVGKSMSKRYSVGSTKANAVDLDDIITMYSEDYNKVRLNEPIRSALWSYC